MVNNGEEVKGGVCWGSWSQGIYDQKRNSDTCTLLSSVFSLLGTHLGNGATHNGRFAHLSEDKITSQRHAQRPSLRWC